MGDAVAAGPMLADVQHLLQHAVLTPHSPAETATAMLAGTTGLSAAQRLQIYRNGCRQRQLEAMAHLHPALRVLLGDELFDDFASEYLEACPSRSSTLARLDVAFADHLSASRPDHDDAQAWIDILIDLARYERVFAEVYDGPGNEQGPQAPRRDVDPDVLGGQQVVMAPCVRALRVSAAVHEYHAAVRSGETPVPPTPQPTCLAVWRRDYRVRVATLSPSACTLLEALLAGSVFSEACAAAALEPSAALGLLRAWSESGWGCTLVEPTSAPPHEPVAPSALSTASVPSTSSASTGA